MFALQWLLRSCPTALHILIEIIRPLFKTTVLIYRHKRARPWPCSALPWIAAPAPSKEPSVCLAVFSFDYTSHILALFFVSFCFDICRVREENLCKEYLSKQINTSLFRLTTSIDYIMLCSAASLPFFPSSDGVHKASRSHHSMWKRTVH